VTQKDPFIGITGQRQRIKMGEGDGVLQQVLDYGEEPGERLELVESVAVFGGFSWY